MDFTRRPRVSRPVDTLAEEYPHVLTLYKKPPDGELLLSEFETLAFDRVQVLQILEQATQMGHKLYSSEWRIAVLGYLRKQNLRRYVRLIESAGCGTADADSHIRREDYISHFILRLAYCRSKELRNWFVARELELFKMRFQSLSTDGVKQFMDSTKLGYSPISNEMKDEIKSGLLQSTVGYSPAAIDNSDFYKVPFIEVLDLVRNMSVYIHKGYAYVPTSELVSCLTSWFRTYLTDALEFANKKLPLLDDERISGLLETLHITYTGKDYTNPSDSNKFKVTTENLHTVVRKSFPLCMKSLYDVVKTTHHLRHFGRLQFTLYLKGIGLTLDDAIKYWRSEFCRLIDEETFNKKYLYNVKHAYGAIGNMTSYTPYGCKKIISASPGPGEHHGCPFKTWDSETLKQKLLESGASQEGTREVLEVATKGHYQIACSKFFMYTHGGVESQNGIINHPNQYYEQSRELLGNSASSIEASSTKKRKFPNAFGTASSHSQASSQVSNSSSSQTQQSTPTTDEALFDDDLDLSQVPDTMDAE